MAEKLRRNVDYLIKLNYHIRSTCNAVICVTYDENRKSKIEIE